MKIVLPWLRELVDVPGDPEVSRTRLALRGFEVAPVERRRQPVIDFEITANRPDCLSHLGLAREAAAIWNLPLRLPERTTAAGRAAPAGRSRRDFDVRLEDRRALPAVLRAGVRGRRSVPRRSGSPSGSRPPASARSATSSTSPTT